MKRLRAYLEIRYEKNKNGTKRGPYAFLAMKTVEGRKIRLAINRHEWNFYTTCVDLKQPTVLRDRMREQARLSRRYWTTKRRVGRPSYYPEEAITILDELGYKVRGKQILVNWSRYLVPAVLALRFALLPIEQQQLVGSPECLAEITIDARCRLKSANRNRRPTTFASCFAEAVLAASPNAILIGSPIAPNPNEPKAAPVIA